MPESRLPGVVIDAARASDLARIVELLTGVGLPTSDLAASAAPQFLVARRASHVLGAVAVERYGETGLLRSLVVESTARGIGVATALVGAAERRAAGVGIRHLVLLTQTAASFFEPLGYLRAPRSDAPAAVQASSEFRQVCPESAACLVKRLAAPAAGEAGAAVGHVLFLCTANSARSILGEAILNGLGAPRFKAFSAGSSPSGSVNPLALELLQKNGLSTEGLRSKSWDEFAAAGAPRMDFVFTVCDAAAGEACPLWPGQPITAHWGVPDPAAVVGPHEERRRAFVHAYSTLRHRIQLFLSLPHASLDGRTLSEQVGAIGRG